MRVEIHHLAMAEAKAARRYYARINTALARRFEFDLDETVAKILQFPQAWPKHLQGTRFCEPSGAPRRPNRLAHPSAACGALPDNPAKHYPAIQGICDDGELLEPATCKDYLQVRQEGNRQVQRMLKHYSLEVILAIGYRVRSPRGTHFRQWPPRLAAKRSDPRS